MTAGIFSEAITVIVAVEALRPREFSATYVSAISVAIFSEESRGSSRIGFIQPS